MLCCHQMTESEKQEVCSWNYEGEYAVYNLQHSAACGGRAQPFPSQGDA